MSQQSSARSTAVQVLPVDAAVPVCVAWHCRTGDLEQSNANGSGDAWAGNLNGTHQANGQVQSAVGGDATTGDATASGDCCAAADTKPRHGCDKVEPKHPEPPRGHGGDARSGEAHGGDVDQSQSASNDNRTDQASSAVSTAKQEGAPSLFVLPCKPAPPTCRPC